MLHFTPMMMYNAIVTLIKELREMKKGGLNCKKNLQEK